MSITELRERVAGATEMDRALMWSVASHFVITHIGSDDGFWGRLGGLMDADAFVDCALALIDRVKPGWGGNVGFGPPDGCFARIWPGADEGCIPEYSGEAPTPALALISALLAAVEGGRDE